MPIPPSYFEIYYENVGLEKGLEKGREEKAKALRQATLENIKDLLEVKFGKASATELMKQIRKEKDQKKLRRWKQAIKTADSLDENRAQAVGLG